MQSSLEYLRDRGYLCAIVEHWNCFARIRQDLFGIIDILAVRPDETLGVQCTTAKNVAARCAKIADADTTPALREAGWRLEVHGWDGGRLRVEDVS